MNTLNFAKKEGWVATLDESTLAKGFPNRLDNKLYLFALTPVNTCCKLCRLKQHREEQIL